MRVSPIAIFLSIGFICQRHQRHQPTVCRYFILDTGDGPIVATKCISFWEKKKIWERTIFMGNKTEIIWHDTVFFWRRNVCNDLQVTINPILHSCALYIQYKRYHFIFTSNTFELWWLKSMYSTKMPYLHSNCSIAVHKHLCITKKFMNGSLKLRQLQPKK